MDHNTAISSHAAERYALGEMTDAEAGAFEAHFFDCRHCAQDVRDTVSFSEGARAVFAGEEAETPPATDARDDASLPAAFSWARVRAFLPAAAAVVFLAVALYQATVTIPGLKRYARPVVAAPTVLRVVRAAPPVVTLRDGQPTFLLVVDVNAPEGASRYRLDFLSSSGERVTSEDAAAPETGTLHVILPAAMFPAGDYTMNLRTMDAGGETGEVIEEYRFRVEVKRET